MRIKLPILGVVGVVMSLFGGMQPASAGATRLSCTEPSGAGSIIIVFDDQNRSVDRVYLTGPRGILDNLVSNIIVVRLDQFEIQFTAVFNNEPDGNVSTFTIDRTSGALTLVDHNPIHPRDFRFDGSCTKTEEKF